MAQAKAFTAKLKEKGKRYWDAFRQEKEEVVFYKTHIH